MTIAINSTTVTSGGVLQIDATLTAPAGQYIRCFWVTCSAIPGQNAEYLVPRKNYYTNSVMLLSSGRRVTYIPLSMWPNGELVFTVHASYETSAHVLASTDTTVDVPVTNTFYQALKTPQPAALKWIIQKPVVTAFQIPATVESSTVPITSFVVEDNVAVSGYMITESATPPLVAALGWSSTLPASYTVTTPGAKTLYAWAKDADGNVSEMVSASVTATFTDTQSLDSDSSSSMTASQISALTGVFTAPSAIATSTAQQLALVGVLTATNSFSSSSATNSDIQSLNSVYSSDASTTSTAAVGAFVGVLEGVSSAVLSIADVSLCVGNVSEEDAKVLSLSTLSNLTSSVLTGSGSIRSPSGPIKVVDWLGRDVKIVNL